MPREGAIIFRDLAGKLVLNVDGCYLKWSSRWPWIGTMAPPSENVSELKCTSGRTNIDCNNIGVPYRERTRPVGASARSPVHGG